MIDRTHLQNRAARAARALRSVPTRQRTVARGNKAPLAMPPRPRRRPPRRKPMPPATSRVRPLLRLVASNPTQARRPSEPKLKHLRLVGVSTEPPIEALDATERWTNDRPGYDIAALVLGIAGAAAIAVSVGRLLALPL